MKNNNRNRKLEYIREKNNYRLGKRPFTVFSKISNEFMNDEKALEQAIIKIVNDASKEFKNKFKFFLRRVIIRFGDNYDDFIKDQKTLRIELTNKKS